MPPTDNEQAIIEEIVSEQEAEEIGRWERTSPGFTDETVVQWEDSNSTIVVYVERTELDDETKYDVRAKPIEDGVSFGNKVIEHFEESLETAVDSAIQWMRRRRPGVPMSTFSMRIGGGVFKPLMDVLRRFGGQQTLIEVRSGEVYFESASHVNAVDFTISAADMEQFEVSQEGEIAVDTDFLWDALKGVNFSDTVPVAHDADQEQPKLQVADSSTFTNVSTDYFRRPVPEPFPFDARFVIPGLEFRDKINATDVIDGDTAVFGVRDGIVFVRVQSEDAQSEVTARLDASEVEGEQVNLIAHDRLQNLRRAIPRPSQTDVEFTMRGDDPMLAEYRVNGTEVDVTIALKIGPVPREVEIPPEEVQVPEEAEPERGVEEAMDEFVREATAVGEKSTVTIEGRGPDKSIDIVPPPPQQVLEQYPSERKSDNPLHLFVRDVADTVGQTVDVDKFNHGDVVGQLEYGPDGEWQFEEEERNLLELPIETVETTSGLKYVATRGQVTMAVDDEIDREVRDRIGMAGQFSLGQRVGTAFVTDVTPFQQRELVDVEIEERILDQAGGSLREDTAVDGEWTATDLRAFSTEWSSGATRLEVMLDKFGFDSLPLFIAEVGERFPVINEDFMHRWLINQGVTPVTASEVAAHFDSPQELLSALERGDDLTDLEGIGDARAEEVAEELADVTVDVPMETEEVPPPPEEEPEPEETASIIVSIIGGSLNYNVPGRVPGAVEDEAIGAARDTLGPPGQFDVNDTVGEVTFQGSDVLSISLDEGQRILDREPEMELAGELIVGNRRMDVPEPPDGWESIHFLNRNQPNEPGEGDRVVYLSPDRKLSVRIDGTRVSNKWSMRVLQHEDPIPEEPSDDVLLFGPGGSDSDSTRITLTTGNVVDAAAQNILQDNFPTVEEAEEIFAEQEAAARKELEETVEEEQAEGEPDEEPEQEAEVKLDEKDEGGDGEDLLELPVHVEEDFTDGFLYSPPANTVRLAVSRQIDSAMADELGDAEQFDVDQEVGVAFVTDDPDPADRDLVRVEADEGLLEPDREDRPEPEEEPRQPDGMDLSVGEAETIIEEAILGINVDLPRELQMLQEFRLEPVRGEGIRFRQDPDRITVSVGETAEESIQSALDRWAEFAVIDELSPEQVAGINQRREALQGQFGIELPQLPQPTTTGLDDVEIERIVEQATAGVDVSVSITPEADSLRIQFEKDPTSQAVFTGPFEEIQGQASNPMGAVREALDLWERNVEIDSIDPDTVNARRDRLERELDITLSMLDVSRGEVPPEMEEADAVRKFIQAREGLGVTQIDQEDLRETGEFALPVAIEEEVAEMIEGASRAEFESDAVVAGGEIGQAVQQQRAMEGVKQVEQGLQIHFKEEVKDEVHNIVAEMLDSEPENLFDSTKPSDLPRYDLFWHFTLSRDRDDQPWTNPRFQPSQMLERLEEIDSERVKVVTLAAPLR